MTILERISVLHCLPYGQLIGLCVILCICVTVAVISVCASKQCTHDSVHLCYVDVMSVDVFTWMLCQWMCSIAVVLVGDE